MWPAIYICRRRSSDYSWLAGNRFVNWLIIKRYYIADDYNTSGGGTDGADAIVRSIADCHQLAFDPDGSPL
jgi:hypothetical protein